METAICVCGELISRARLTDSG